MLIDALLINKLTMLMDGLKTFAGAAFNYRSSMNKQRLCFDTFRP